jgi:capsular exopolysaccharide synthesis family protein
MRVVRTNVIFSSAESGPRVIAVTSTGPREGKTMVSTNLAVAVAQAGQRVLLIDADMRRPRVNDVFGEVREPGLSDVLVGEARAAESVRATSVKDLWMLPAGRTTPNPAELLGSVRFREFLAGLRERFDWVIIDTPPTMPVTDSAIVSNVASGVLFVVGAEMTSRRAAQAALERLQAGNARFFGAVLNRADLRRHAYCYRSYYRREYADYYASSQA